MAYRDERGQVVEEIDFAANGTVKPCREILAMDAGDNVLRRGTPDQLEVFQRIYRQSIAAGRVTIVGV